MNSILEEWLCPSSVAYLAECLQYCQNSEMLSDLRKFAPSAALREATKRLSQKKRNEIKEWVQALNAASEVLA